MRVLGSNPISQDVRKALTEQGKEGKQKHNIKQI